VSGACADISCRGGDACACWTATYSLRGNQGFTGGSLDLELSVDTSIASLPLGDLQESCGTATGLGKIKDAQSSRELEISVSGLECPTIGASDVFNGTYVITAGSSGKYSAVTSGTGLIVGNQDTASTTEASSSRIFITGLIQPKASLVGTPTPLPISSPSPTSIPTSTPTPSPSPTSVLTATPTPIPTPTVAPPPSATPSPAGCAPIYTGTPQGNDAGFFSAISVPAASTASGCYQVAFVIIDKPGSSYSGYPMGWTPVFGQGVQSEIIIHQNVPNEPANNLWTTAGAISEVYELNISAICDTSGYDGGMIAYSDDDNVDSMTIGAPAIGSTGANDITLAFSNMPWNSVVTMNGPSSITGFYTSVPSLGGYWYLGIPQSLSVNVNPVSPAYEGRGVTFQAAFAPGECPSASAQ
jgi:hypothetical protein